MGGYTNAQLELMRRALVVGDPVVRGGAIEREYRCAYCDQVLMTVEVLPGDAVAETPRDRARAEYDVVEHLRRPPARNRFMGGCTKKPAELLSRAGAARAVAPRRTAAAGGTVAPTVAEIVYESADRRWSIRKRRGVRWWEVHERQPATRPDAPDLDVKHYGSNTLAGARRELAQLRGGPTSGGQDR